MNTPTPDAIWHELAKLLELDAPERPNDQPLEDLRYWDSLTKVSLLGVLNDQFGFSLHPAILDQVTTLNGLFDAIQAHAARSHVSQPS